MHAFTPTRAISSIRFILLIGAVSACFAPPLYACPFCPGPSRTLSEQLSESDVALQVTWISSAPGTLEQSGQTTFEIKTSIKQPGKNRFPKGTRLTVNRHHTGKPGDLFLLFGSQEGKTTWDEPLEVSDTCISYLKQAPGLDQPTTERLRYFLKHLEHPDSKIANDAFAEFANAPFEEIAPLRAELPREKIQSWLANSKTAAPRLGLYGLLLGLCGQQADIAFMEQEINQQTQELRFGIGGLISGYLMLTGSEGLTLIEQKKFLAPDAAFSETYAAMQALSFIWTFGNQKISKDRLRASMRLLLDRPELADLVVANLARWEDWSVMDRLMRMYQHKDYQNRSFKKSVVRYLKVAAKEKQPAGTGPDATTRQKAGQLLDQLRKNDPATVESAERFF